MDKATKAKIKQDKKDNAARAFNFKLAARNGEDY